MKFRYSIIGLFLCSAFLAGCSAPIPGQADPVFSSDVDTERKPWTSEEFVNDPEDFQFAIVSDNTGGARSGVFEAAVEKLNLLKPEFVISVGDLISGGTHSPEVLTEEWAEFDGFIDNLEAPFFHIPGNHDIGNEVMHDWWLEKFGRDYYHFVYHDVLFLCLNSEDPPPSNISQEQIDYMAEALADNPDVRWTMIFLHKPFWSDGNPGWLKIEEMIKDRPHTVLAGHHHYYVSYERNGRDYIKLATTGGGSSLLGPDFGLFDHIVWVTMTDEGPQLANLMLDGIRDKNVHTEEMSGLSKTLGGRHWVTAQEVSLIGDAFEGASTTILLKNLAPAPLIVKGVFRPNKQMKPAPAEFNVIVPPKSNMEVPIEIGAAPGTLVKDLSTLMLDVTGSYERKGKKPLARTVTQNLVGTQAAACQWSLAPVLIDGRLNEWASSLDINCNKPEQVEGNAAAFAGTRDARQRFGTAYDDEFLYIAITTFDDKRVRDASAEIWDQDALIVNLDVRETTKRSQPRQGHWDKRFEDFLLFEMCPGADGKLKIHEGERLPKGVKVACIDSEYSEGGMTAEIAVPLSYVKEKQGGNWSDFRLNVGLIDCDGVKDDRAVIWWKPAWSKVKNYSGSGTFVKR